MFSKGRWVSDGGELFYGGVTSIYFSIYIL